MGKILLVETSTRVCSVGVSSDAELVAVKELNTADYSHSTVLTSFIQEVLADAAIDIKELSAVAISMGPGSYTGLRIGVSAAKGICYALDIPLIAVDTLLSMAYAAKETLSADKERKHLLGENAVFCPMIDARRMEVFLNLFDHDLAPLGTTRAEIIEHDTFSKLDEKKQLLIFGDGAMKCKDVIKRNQTIFFPDLLPSAKGMAAEAWNKFSKKEFVNVAYFEPFYLKDFVAGAPRVKGLHS